MIPGTFTFLVRSFINLVNSWQTENCYSVQIKCIMVVMIRLKY
nr:MAG TPA: hypothetical protein [Caudoviricetes sp.]